MILYYTASNDFQIWRGGENSAFVLDHLGAQMYGVEVTHVKDPNTEYFIQIDKYPLFNRSLNLDLILEMTRI